jgi:hypothetical protein
MPLAFLGRFLGRAVGGIGITAAMVAGYAGLIAHLRRGGVVIAVLVVIFVAQSWKHIVDIYFICKNNWFKIVFLE